MPQASQVAAASVRTSCEGIDSERAWRRMADSGWDGETILRGRRLTDWDKLLRSSLIAASPSRGCIGDVREFVESTSAILGLTFHESF